MTKKKKKEHTRKELMLHNTFDAIESLLSVIAYELDYKKYQQEKLEIYRPERKKEWEDLNRIFKALSLIDKVKIKLLN